VHAKPSTAKVENVICTSQYYETIIMTIITIPVYIFIEILIYEMITFYTLLFLKKKKEKEKKR